jgi:hypothetical protein
MTKWGIIGVIWCGQAGDRARTGDVQLGKLDWKPSRSTALQGFLIGMPAHVRCLVRCFASESRLVDGRERGQPHRNSDR